MPIFASRCAAIWALFAVCLDLSAKPLCIQAQDVEVTDDSANAPEPVQEASEGGEAADEDKGQQFVDSAKELQEKLAQLKALLDAKEGGADPGLKEKLAGLENQLKGLGLDGLTGGGESQEVTEFLGACVAMSMRRLGMQRPATLGALKKLVDNKLPPEEAAKNELWRMVGVCVQDFKEDEFADFKAGKVKVLPKAYVDASKKPEAEKMIMDMDAQHWESLRTISKGLLTELTGGSGESPPFNAAYLAMIPLVLMVAFMAKLFLDMKKRNEEEAKKKSKKSK
jgi:hypothetical protein